MHKSRAALYGESIFTSFRSMNGKVPLIDEHLNRLFNGANFYFFDNRFTLAEFKEFINKKIELTHKIKQNPDAYFRIDITLDKSEKFLALNSSLSEINISLQIQKRSFTESSLKLMTQESPFSEFFVPIKSGSYFQNFYAKKQALKNRFDDVLFKRGSELLECSTSNIIFQKDKTFVTSNARGILPGINLKNFESFCVKNNLIFKYENLSIDMIKQFDHCFISNSVNLLTCVSLIDQIEFKLNIEFAKKYRGSFYEKN